MVLDDKLAVGDDIVLDGAIGSEIDLLGGKIIPRGEVRRGQSAASRHLRRAKGFAGTMSNVACLGRRP